MFSSEMVEAFKQIIRTAVLAVIPLVISALSSGAQQIDWRAIIISAIIAILTGLDKYLHENDVKTPLDMKGGIMDSLKN